LGANRPKFFRSALKKLKFLNRPAIGRTTVSSPAVMKCFESLNAGKAYSDQIKPFNFLLTCHVIPFGFPDGVDGDKFQLISPFDSDPRKWCDIEWIDRYSVRQYRITTEGHCGLKGIARVKTYGDVLAEYEHHPESKCADALGRPCGRQTVGILYRRHVKIDQVKFIGKESNSLENVEAGLIHSGENVYTEYVDPRRDEWITKILPALKVSPLRVLVKKCQGRLSRRALINLRAGRSRPHRKNQKLLASVLNRLSPG
jgi:hypothetical protein